VAHAPTPLESCHEIPRERASPRYALLFERGNARAAARAPVALAQAG
jgi:hypothetical protein